jgi:hypothetical protein
MNTSAQGGHKILGMEGGEVMFVINLLSGMMK